MIGKYKQHTPEIDDSVYVAPTAAVIGDVVIGPESSVWFGAVVRGDDFSIRIGRGTNVQDNAVIHDSTTIGDYVTIGHSAVVHACKVENGVLIGMGAIVLDKAVIGEGAVIAAGSVVRVGTVVPPRTLFAGNPAVMKKEIDERVVAENLHHAEYYCGLAKEFMNS